LSALSSLIFCLEASSTIEQSRNHMKSNPTAGSTRDSFLRHILHNSPAYGNFSAADSQTYPSKVPLKVGIIGAGVAGLYSAILLESLGIDYEILEANTRIGGRIYTHRFDEAAWLKSKPGEPDYYNYYVSIITSIFGKENTNISSQDVGAMRFPGMTWMDRIIGTQNSSLVSYINANVNSAVDEVTLIPYYFQSNNTFRLYNDKLVYNQITPSADTFGVLTSEGGTIAPSSFAAMSPGTVLDLALKDLLTALVEDFDIGFSKLMEYDQLSVRAYLLQQGYTSQEIDWMETIDDATEHYDCGSLSQATLESWIFDESPLDTWQCVEGGMDRIINGMVKILKTPVVTSKRVTGLRPGADGEVTVVINDTEERNYAHVINTAPLGDIQTMDMTQLNLDYAKKSAIRQLRYDPAGKIGMAFKTRW
jgi:hypothetical protein